MSLPICSSFEGTLGQLQDRRKTHGPQKRPQDPEDLEFRSPRLGPDFGQTGPLAQAPEARKSVGYGQWVDLGGRRIPKTTNTSTPPCPAVASG